MADKPEKINVNFRADASKIAAIDAIARTQDRDRSYIINQAVESFIAHRQWMDTEIRKAVKDAEAGKFLSDQEVTAMYREWGVQE